MPGSRRSKAVRQGAASPGRLHGVFRRGPGVGARPGGRQGEPAGNGRAAHGLDGMACLPAADHRAQAALGQDVPERLAGAGTGADGAHPGAVGGGFDELVDAVPVGAFAGGDARPEDRREQRREGMEVAHRATLDQPLEMGHPPGVEQRVDHLPIGGVPTDEQDAER